MRVKRPLGHGPGVRLACWTLAGLAVACVGHAVVGDPVQAASTIWVPGSALSLTLATAALGSRK
jgi:hypothetical protein